MPMPMNSCRAPKEKWKAPANRPSCCGVSAKACCNGDAMMAATVRKAWLRAKPVISTSSISQGERGVEVVDTTSHFKASELHFGFADALELRRHLVAHLCGEHAAPGAGGDDGAG